MDSVTGPTAAPTPAAVAARLLVDLPAFHGHGELHWDVSRGTLELLAALTRPGCRSLEIGLGASTVVLAAAPGAAHTAVGPARHEIERVTSYCERIGVDPGAITFLHGPSDRVLPGLTGEFDVVLIDGAHAFPFAIVDYHYVSRLLAPQGVLVLDDLPIPAVQVLYRYLVSDPAWELVTITDDRAAAFRLLSPVPGGDPWQEQPFNRSYPDFSFLPLRGRWRAATFSRLVSSGRLRTRLAQHPRLAGAARRIYRRMG